MKQLALAANNYEAANGFYPPGSQGSPYIGTGSFIGALAYLLPYIEQQNLYILIPSYELSLPVPATSVPYYDNGGAWTAANNVVKTFLCPSDNAQTVQPTGGTWVFIEVVGANNAGSLYDSGAYWPWPDYPTLGKTDYSPSAGWGGLVYQPYMGVYYGSSQTTIPTITQADGTSQTIGFGEWLGGTDTGPRDFVGSWIMAAGLPTAYGFSSPSTWYRFSSKHINIVQFAFCDGSVRAIKKGANTTQFWYASGYQDGQVINWSALGE